MTLPHGFLQMHKSATAATLIMSTQLGTVYICRVVGKEAVSLNVPQITLMAGPHHLEIVDDQAD